MRKRSQRSRGLTVSAAEVCRTAGYLCADRGSFQIARWQLDKGKLRVRVRLPEFVDAETARELREAAIEGIMEWGRPSVPARHRYRQIHPPILGHRRRVVPGFVQRQCWCGARRRLGRRQAFGVQGRWYGGPPAAHAGGGGGGLRTTLLPPPLGAGRDGGVGGGEATSAGTSDSRCPA